MLLMFGFYYLNTNNKSLIVSPIIKLRQPIHSNKKMKEMC